MNQKLAKKIKGDRRFAIQRSVRARRRIHLGFMTIMFLEQFGFMVSYARAEDSVPRRSHICLHLPFVSIYIYTSNVEGVINKKYEPSK